jgi:hypothetical protein
MSIEAMKQALEALERADKINGYANNKKAITALRQAIEQAEKQKPVGYLYDWLNPDNRDEVIRDWFAASMYVIEKDKGFNVRPLYTAPVHASENAEKQEPVAWMWKDGTLTSDPDFADGTWTPLFTAPPKREWVGLTDEERFLNDARSKEEIEYAKAIEAKLKEKNHG